MSGDIVAHWFDANEMRTHSESCWQWHPSCAIARLGDDIQKLQSKVSELSLTLMVRDSEMDELINLITIWADAENRDGWHEEPECDCGNPRCDAVISLRRAVGK